jgi:signal transduction histidine kinase
MESRILIADDERDYRDILVKILESKKLSIEVAGDGAEAFTRLCSERFDTLVTDVRMPKMSGFDLMKNIRHLQPDLPIIIVTAFADLELAIESLNLGADGLFTKPFDAENLYNKINQCLMKRQLSETLLQSSKMFSLGELTTAIVHELRNVLLGINLSANVLQKKGGGELKDNSNIKGISEGVERAGRLINHLLNFARPSDKLAEVNLGQFFDSLLILVNDRLKGQNIRVEKEVDNLQVIGVMDSFNIIFLNLISNAIQSMEKGGTLKISARRNNRIEVEISDTGYGIPDEIQKNIFDMFFTTKGEKGNGIGLALVKKEVERMGGEIMVKSAVGMGSAFTVILPKDHGYLAVN